MLYNKDALRRHQESGDVSGPMAESGFKGHPSCRCGRAMPQYRCTAPYSPPLGLPKGGRGGRVQHRQGSLCSAARYGGGSPGAPTKRLSAGPVTPTPRVSASGPSPPLAQCVCGRVVRAFTPRRRASCFPSFGWPWAAGSAAPASTTPPSCTATWRAATSTASCAGGLRQTSTSTTGTTGSSRVRACVPGACLVLGLVVSPMR